MLGPERFNDGGVDEGIVGLVQVEHFEAKIQEVLVFSCQRPLYLEDVSLHQVFVLQLIDFPCELYGGLNVVESLGRKVDRGVNHGDVLGLTRHIIHIVAFRIDVVGDDSELAIRCFWLQRGKAGRVDFQVETVAVAVGPDIMGCDFLHL